MLRPSTLIAVGLVLASGVSAVVPVWGQVGHKQLLSLSSIVAETVSNQVRGYWIWWRDCLRLRTGLHEVERLLLAVLAGNCTASIHHRCPGLIRPAHVSFIDLHRGRRVDDPRARLLIHSRSRKFYPVASTYTLKV